MMSLRAERSNCRAAQQCDHSRLPWTIVVAYECVRSSRTLSTLKRLKAAGTTAYAHGDE
jgi:hypothetical protein